MQATMRKIGALCQKDFIDMFKNPSMLVCLIMPIGFAVLFRYMLSDVGVATVGEDPNAAGAAVGQILATFELSSSLCMAIGMVVSMAVVYGIAEEKEKHTLRTLMLANVSAGQIIVSRALISLVLGLASRDQMTAGLYAVPVILIALAPMFGAYNETVSDFVLYLPTGGMNTLVGLMMQGNLFTNEALVPLAVTLGWTVGCAILFVALFKRLVRDN